eukprot:TRINITY_DN22951_c0_g1_i1.p1 TRINITY_DN22951_c0_g1~~TRINITY_DN22951_c0_g1_i1.p1  ORF type:complete len:333 (+),score=118.74 TRINITY_DN22951_c0_g1_i1:96-1094(+)
MKLSGAERSVDLEDPGGVSARDGFREKVKSWFFIQEQARPEVLLMTLSGFFFVNTMTAELISGKLFELGPFVLSMGSLMWPVVFVFTDVINEYYGRKIVRRLTIVTSVTLLWVFLLIFVAIGIPASEVSPIDDPTFATVFAQGNWIIVGSLVAFVVSQVLDITVFHFLRVRTRNRHLWLRTTGSTLASQLADTYIVSGIAFLLPGHITFWVYINLCTISYAYKVMVALLMTPAIYGVHYVIDGFLGKKVAQQMVANCMAENASEDATEASFERLPADSRPSEPSDAVELVPLDPDGTAERVSLSASGSTSPTVSPSNHRRTSAHNLHADPED